MNLLLISIQYPPFKSSCAVQMRDLAEQFLLEGHSPTVIIPDERIKTKERLKLIKRKIPLNKFSTTKQIADIVYFLTTSSAASITGTSIVTDGGWTSGK